MAVDHLTRPIVVSALSTTPVKATRLRPVQQIELGELGARGDRAFYVIDERGRMVNGKRFGELQTVVAGYDPAGGELSLTFPDGTVARGQVAYGETLTTRFVSQTSEARLVRGPWEEALSAYLGHPLRLVEPRVGAIDRGRRGAVSLISRASLRRLGEVAAEEVDAGGVDGVDAGEVDARRFRMLIEVDGLKPHEEDGWVGRRVRVGAALLAIHGNIGRCLVTSRHPETGEIDLPTLDLLRGYRRDVESTEPLPFGIHGEVLEPGTVHVGDEIALHE